MMRSRRGEVDRDRLKHENGVWVTQFEGCFLYGPLEHLSALDLVLRYHHGKGRVFWLL